MTARAGWRFAHRLALYLGEWDVQGMLARMSSSQLAAWAAFYELEPFGAAVEDHRAGTIAATVGNMAGKTLRKGERLTPATFFRARTGKARRAVDAERAAVVEQVHAVFGPLVRRAGVRGGDPR